MAKNRGQGTEQQPQPTPQPTPGEKKRGDLKPSEEQKRSRSEGSRSEPVEKEGEMSAAQARGLLNSLRSEEDRVRLMQRQEHGGYFEGLVMKARTEKFLFFFALRDDRFGSAPAVAQQVRAELSQEYAAVGQPVRLKYR